jgi:hypothetical protein
MELTTDLLIKELWRAIDGFPGYWVSTDGRVCKTSSQGPGHLVRAHAGKDGYLQLILIRDGKVYTRLVARLVALAWIPNPENKPEVNHKDGNKLCNSTENLEWSTRKEQMVHAFETGLAKNADTRKRFTPEDHALIHQYAQQGLSHRAIAKVTGFNRTTVINSLKNNAFSS